MLGHLRVQRRLQDPAGHPGQQPARPGQRHTAGPGLLQQVTGNRYFQILTGRPARPSRLRRLVLDLSHQ
jgi:hypothetical protein